MGNSKSVHHHNTDEINKSIENVRLQNDKLKNNLILLKNNIETYTKDVNQFNSDVIQYKNCVKNSFDDIEYNMSQLKSYVNISFDNLCSSFNLIDYKINQVKDNLLEYEIMNNKEHIETQYYLWYLRKQQQKIIEFNKLIYLKNKIEFEMKRRDDNEQLYQLSQNQINIVNIFVSNQSDTLYKPMTLLLESNKISLVEKISLDTENIITMLSEFSDLENKLENSIDSYSEYSNLIHPLSIQITPEILVEKIFTNTNITSLSQVNPDNEQYLVSSGFYPIPEYKYSDLRKKIFLGLTILQKYTLNPEDESDEILIEYLYKNNNLKSIDNMINFILNHSNSLYKFDENTKILKLKLELYNYCLQNKLTLSIIHEDIQFINEIINDINIDSDINNVLLNKLGYFNESWFVINIIKYQINVIKNKDDFDLLNETKNFLQNYQKTTDYTKLIQHILKNDFDVNNLYLQIDKINQKLNKYFFSHIVKSFIICFTNYIISNKTKILKISIIDTKQIKITFNLKLLKHIGELYTFEDNTKKNKVFKKIINKICVNVLNYLLYTK